VAGCSGSVLRAVVDTNVFVSGTILSRGNPFEILEAWRRGKFILTTSREIVAEVEAVLRRPNIFRKYRLTEAQLTRLLNALEHEATVAAPSGIDPPASILPVDLKFLACAQAGSADYLVTGDQELLKLRAFQGGGPHRSWTPKAQPLCHGPQALYIVTLEIG